MSAQQDTPLTPTPSMPVSHSPVSFRRRFGAIAYDLLAVVALLFFTTLPIVITLDRDIEPGNPFYFFYQITCAFFYFGYCWTTGGQTLGMAAWKITLKDSTHRGAVNTKAALTRFLSAGFSLGLGLLGALFRKDRLAWHDRLSKTHLEHLEIEHLEN